MLATASAYSGLGRALELGSEGVIAAVRESGLRDEGRAGRLTASRWRACADVQTDEKYAVCNAIDSDPWSRAARLQLGGDPGSVLAGLLIGAFAIGATRAFVCVNSQYEDEIAQVQRVLQQMRDARLLGDRILGSGFSCEIELKSLPSSLVAGQEGALLAALEGRQALPDLRFAHPAERGLDGRPTLIDAAETLAVVSALFQRQPSPGVPGSAGADVGQAVATKVVTLRGDVEQELTTEVAFGTPLAAIIAELERGAAGDLPIQAVQVGGPTGAFIRGDRLEVPFSHQGLEEVGAHIGSGSIRVFRGNVCPVEMTRDVMSYLQGESCGKCVSCREVMRQIVGLLTDIAANRGTPDDLDLLLELAAFMEDDSICDVGRNGARPVLSSLGLFADDFKSHLEDQRCTSGEAG